MAAFLAFAAILVAPLLLIGLIVRIIRRWEGRWRYVAILPAIVLLADLWIAFSRASPHGDGFIAMAVLNVVTLVVLYVLSEVRARPRS